MILEIDIPEWAEPLEEEARYLGAWGGRGSGKSHYFAEKLIETCVRKKTEAVCIREIQKSLSKSAKKLLENKIESLGVSHLFEVQNDLIKCHHGGVILFQGMQDHTADSIKSLEGMDIAWVEEAQSLSERSLELLRPTIRGENSQIWFSWNPFRRTDAVDKFLRGTKPKNSIVVRANFSDNPWLPKVLLEEQELDKSRITDQTSQDKYNHVWLGHYVSMTATQFIPTYMIEEASGRHLRPDQYNFAPVIISCDPAWEGDDDLVIGKRQGLTFKVLERLEKNDNDFVVANKIARYEDEYKADAVFIDGGYGTGIISGGRTMGRNWQIVWFNGKSSRKDCVNKRAEMIANIKDWIEAGGSFEENSKLEEELISLETLPDEGGRIKFPKKQKQKEDLGRSPNDMDALGLTFAFPVHKKLPKHMQNNKKFDPLARLR